MKIFSWSCFTCSICVYKIICRIWYINTYRFVIFLKFCIIFYKCTNKIPWMEEPGMLQSMGSLRSDTTEQLHFHFSLSCIGEGNGNPLQCSCLENPRDRGAWWAAVYGVAQSQTRLKRLSSSSSSSTNNITTILLNIGVIYLFLAMPHSLWDLWSSFLEQSWQ